MIHTLHWACKWVVGGDWNMVECPRDRSEDVVEL